MAKKRQPSPAKKKRRKKRRHDPRSAQIRGILIGGALVLAAFVGVGLIALYELQLEEAERLEAAKAPPAPAPTPVGSASPEEEAGATPAPTAVSELKLGLSERKVHALLGAPDAALDDHRFRYERLGIELAYQDGPAGDRVLSAMRLGGPSAHDAPASDAQAALMGALGLEGIALGGDPQALRSVLPKGRVLRDRATGTYTLYAPERRLAVDFTPDRIVAVRQAARIEGELAARLQGPNTFEVALSKAFDAQAMLPQPLTDHQVETTSRRIESAGGVARALELRLKVDDFEVDALRALIKRRVAMQVAAGDAAVAITVRSRNGSKLVACDWYSPGYAQRAGATPARLGSVDSADNLSWRWY